MTLTFDVLSGNLGEEGPVIAADVSIEDVAEWFDSTNVEDALAETAQWIENVTDSILPTAQGEATAEVDEHRSESGAHVATQITYEGNAQGSFGSSTTVEQSLDYIAANYPTNSVIGAANGICPLGGDSKVPSAYLPTSGGGGVLEYANFAAFPGTGTTGTVYLALDTGRTYRWNNGTSAYVDFPGRIDGGSY